MVDQAGLGGPAAVWAACSSASSTNCALAVWLARQPHFLSMGRRANTSMTNATQTMPAQVGTWVTSLTHHPSAGG